MEGLNSGAEKRMQLLMLWLLDSVSCSPSYKLKLQKCGGVKKHRFFSFER